MTGKSNAQANCLEPAKGPYRSLTEHILMWEGAREQYRVASNPQTIDKATSCTIMDSQSP